MKATQEIREGLFPNEEQFHDSFFQRFSLRHAPRPLELSATVSKNYRFPTFYADTRCAIGIFLCSYERAREILPDPKLRPVRMPGGRTVVTFSCYEYRNVMNVAPYNEIAMTIPVLFDPKVDVPVLPLLTPSYPGFGFYVFGMPVTSKENQLRGNKIWGLPKVTQAIDIIETGDACETVAFEETGEEYFRLRVPKAGKATEFDVRTYLYSELDGRLLKSETNFRGTFAMSKFLKRLWSKPAPGPSQWLTIGSTRSAKILRHLEIEPEPFQFRYTPGMNAAFDLPRPEFERVIEKSREAAAQKTRPPEASV